jgi:alkanesulfonate monooxygenase SsuD/methylene tetrahydromethanopterin reductase-like flavin-dependent oxidoreductase (luciferase family)
MMKRRIYLSVAAPTEDNVTHIQDRLGSYARVGGLREYRQSHRVLREEAPVTTRRRLNVGLLLPTFEGSFDGATPRWADLLDLARQAEALGFDSVWVCDHLLYPPEKPFNPRGTPESAAAKFVRTEPMGMWESWSLLAALAVAVPRLELGTLVTCTLYRNPALLAKMADTLEEISGGRVILGLGAGNAPYEQYVFGYPGDRLVGRFEEAVKIIHTLLRTGECHFAGEFYQVRKCRLRPRGPRPGGPPIMIGALQNRPRMLRLTAQYADIWNTYLGPAFWSLPSTIRPFDIVPPAVAALHSACQAIGRNPATLEQSVVVGVSPLGFEVSGLTDITGTPQEIADQLAAFVAAGVSHLQVILGRTTPAALDAFAPVLNDLKARGA